MAEILDVRYVIAIDKYERESLKGTALGKKLDKAERQLENQKPQLHPGRTIAPRQVEVLSPCDFCGRMFHRPSSHEPWCERNPKHKKKLGPRKTKLLPAHATSHKEE